MTPWPDLASGLLRAYAAALTASGYGPAALPVLARAAALEHSPSAAQWQALRAAGLLTGAGTLTREGWAALAGVLDERGGA
ncbi:hypothetical protein [Deinococcus sp. NW-56]|uniref:hypothetical protein n=1 Tax=Deinococcus sp. NW-56 TaxID=2080419 RepID=UPI000CF5394C|nr:hypothetical protein [Deinococcus sp. NW-56]